MNRKHLHGLVWSEPVTAVAARLGISDVALAKACERAFVPVPPRGWWARKASGQRVLVTPLPPRPPGMDEAVRLGGWWHNEPSPSEAEILGPLPPEPAFEEALDTVRERVTAAIGTVKAPEDLSRPHRAIAGLLAEDEERRKRWLASPYRSDYDAPRFDSPSEKRRLRLLSGLFDAVARYRCKPTLGSPERRAVCVQVGHQHVQLRLEPVEPKSARPRAGAKAVPGRTGLELSILEGWGEAAKPVRTWSDGETKLEAVLAAVAVEVVVEGERRYRDGALHAHAWRVRCKTELEEETRRRKAEAERLERERRLGLERERVDRLLGQAEALRKAREIRAYVEEVRRLNASLATPLTPDALEGWAAWASGVADRLDPLVSGAFRRVMEEVAEGDGSLAGAGES